VAEITVGVRGYARLAMSTEKGSLMRGKDGNRKPAPECCRATEPKGQGLLWGLFYGLAPHTFCILFIVFSIMGATVATSLVRQVMLVPYLFQIIVAVSLGFATLSAILYLRRNGLLSWAGARRKWRYLGVMYGTTLAVNVLMFWLVFPAAANLDLPSVSAAPPSISMPSERGPSQVDPVNVEQVTLRVDIPCPGHAPLIIGELKKAPGVQTVKYESPDLFRVNLDKTVTSADKILAQEVFQSFPASVIP